tara:strand:+ start:2213 stop:3364 length:1152 start_codon:yes stop_codon:yes gene_type:complete
MDSYGTDEAIQQLNSSRQYVAEQNALINQNNLKRKEDKDSKIQQDSIMGDFNYAKDSINDLYAGTGIQQAVSSYNSRLKGNKLKAQKLKAKTLGGQTEEEYGKTQVKNAYESQPKSVLSPEAQQAFEEQKQRFKQPVSRQSFSNTPADTATPTTPATPAPAPADTATPNPKVPADTATPAPAKPATPAPATPTEPEPEPEALTTEPTTEPEPDKLQAPPAPEEETPESKGLLTKAIKGATGLSDESAELAGRVGGALTGATLGGMSLYDDISNKAKTGSFFDPKDSGADDVSNVTNIIAGASDVVGLVPGLEWVAGVGNAIGGIGGIVKMFGDHSKNVKQQQQDQTSFKPVQNIQTNLSDITGRVDQTAQSNVREQTTSSSAY